jgi:predicted RNA-binding protein YlqC (UPF0109 family)
MEEFIEYLAKLLVNHPDEIKVNRLEDDEDGRERYQLFVAPSDRGKIIGRRGRTIKSIKILIGAAAARIGRRASFEIYDEFIRPEKPEKDDEK